MQTFTTVYVYKWYILRAEIKTSSWEFCIQVESKKLGRTLNSKVYDKKKENFL